MSIKGTCRCIDDPGMNELAEDMKILSDPNRLRMVCILLKGEKCVCEVEEEMLISQQLASHHLNILKDSGFLTSRKEGTSSYYSVNREKLERMTQIFTTYLDCRERECAGGADLIRWGNPGESGNCSIPYAREKGWAEE